MAATTIVFWSVLAAAFLGLAVIAQIEARAIKRMEHPLGGLPQPEGSPPREARLPGDLDVNIPSPVVRALRRILIVEILGFVLAAAAALFEAFAVQ